MFDFESLNKDYSSPFTYAMREDAPFVKISDLDAEKTYTLVNLYINTKSKYGAHPVAGIAEDNGIWVSLPNHLTDTAKAILSNTEAIEAINNKKCGIKARKFHSDKYNNCYNYSKYFFHIQFRFCVISFSSTHIKPPFYLVQYITKCYDFQLLSSNIIKNYYISSKKSLIVGDLLIP